MEENELPPNLLEDINRATIEILDVLANEEQVEYFEEVIRKLLGC